VGVIEFAILMVGGDETADALGTGIGLAIAAALGALVGRFIYDLRRRRRRG